MELVKKNIHMNKIKSRQTMQITLDDDFNVPDVKPDIEKIIKAQANVCVTDYKMVSQKLMLTGEMTFTVLYISGEDGRVVHCLNGKIPFEDVVNMENADVDDMIKVNAALDDLTANMVNSRKISIRSIVTFECVAENIQDLETAIDIVGSESDGDIEYIDKEITVTQIAVNKKDICRVKQEIILPSSKQNVMEILYSDVALWAVDSRLTDEGINLKGEFVVFVMYASENGDTEYIEKEIPFTSSVEVEGCDSDMIDDVRAYLQSSDVIVKADTDGEERILELEAVISLDIKLYYEEKLKIISDFYSTGKDLKPVVVPGYYDNILLKNNSKVRVTDRIRVEDNQPALMQLCSSSAVVRIDDMEVVEDDALGGNANQGSGIRVEGVIDMTLMYVTNDDAMPINAVNGLIPFTHMIEVNGIDLDSVYSVRPGVDNCSVMMTDSREFEVKVTVALDAIVFDRKKEYIICDYEQNDITDEEMMARPAMIGYIVKENDTLWELAKKYRTTRECIRTMNFMEEDEVKAGDRLLIIM